MKNKDYLKILLEKYYPIHFFSLFRAHELYSVSPFLKYLQEPILDLGCGDGLIASILFNEKLEYGIDASEHAVNLASTNNVYNKVFLGNAHNIPVPNNCLGGIFSNCVFEHIPNIDKLAKEISRILKPNAYLVTTCLTPQYYELNPLFKLLNNPLTKKIREILITKENELHNHVSIYTTDEYKEIFAKYGLILEYQKYYSTKKSIYKTCLLDTLSKFRWSKTLSHRGLYIDYLYKKYPTNIKMKC
ncbi:MAG: class I SAM-dependent methyltransferase [Sulfurimonas sp.]|nr:class I SAM-dependent methyltransferase [Sulfurimonas sp.]